MAAINDETVISLSEIHNFNQLARDRWMRTKAASVASGLRVLDVGAGTCLYRSLFVHCDYKTQDFKQYDGCEKLGGTHEYGQIDYVSDILDIPVPDHTFDIVICTEVLEHTPEPILALREISRVLKNGGRAFVTAPLGSGLHQLPYHFYGGYTPEWYKRFGPRWGLFPIEITPNGGFLKHLAQESARAAGLLANQPHLHGTDALEMIHFLHERLPRFLFTLDNQFFLDKFTVGYFVEFVKENPRLTSYSPHMLSDNLNNLETLDAVLREKMLWDGVSLLRLHLGCGEKRLEGYVNIDYPSDKHQVMRPAVDHEADILKLCCTDNTVDEIRLHHVFEHFNRVQALALLIRWHRWLKMGGRLRIETPDLMGCAQVLMSASISPKTRMGIVRHLVGDQADIWAYHVDQWYEERFRNTLGKLGFSIISVKHRQWPHEPFLANVDVVAEKSAERTVNEQLEVARVLLRDAMVSDVEQATHAVWCDQLTALFEDSTQDITDEYLHLSVPETKSDVAVKLKGGLGNQMFQFAAGLALARRLGGRLTLDLSFLHNQSPRPGFTPREYALDAFCLIPDCEINFSKDILEKALPNRIEKSFEFDPDFHIWGASYLDGYWQNPKYFESIAEVLREAFDLRTPLSSTRQALAEQIAQGNSVCVHVRRGDMVHDSATHAVHGACHLTYYQKACALLASNHPDAHFYIFSDEPDWCQTVDLTCGYPHTLVSDGGSAAEDFTLMRPCRHFIIANSTLSWWAAYLGNAPDKFVIAPDPWFDTPTLDASDLLPPNWMKLAKNPNMHPVSTRLENAQNHDSTENGMVEVLGLVSQVERMININNLEAAIALYRNWLSTKSETSPLAYAIYFNLGVLLVHKQNIPGAIQAFEKALQLKVDFEPALNNLKTLLKQ